MKQRKSLRDTLLDNQKALDHYATLAGKPQTQHIDIKPKRERAAPKPSEIPSEHQEQVAFVKWFRHQHPKVRIFAIPNAAKRSYELAAYLKAEGMDTGVPDLYIPEWKQWIEFKRIKGSIISDDQKEWAEYLIGIGDKHFFAFGCEDAIRKLHNAALRGGEASRSNAELGRED